VAALIDQIREVGVPAIFGSRCSRVRSWSRSAARRASATSTSFATTIHPGEPGDPEYTYVGMLKADVQLMASALAATRALWTVSTRPIRIVRKRLVQNRRGNKRPGTGVPGVG